VLTIPNGITALRLFGSLLIPLYLFWHWPLDNPEERLSLVLACLFLACTDLIDGWAARAADQVSDFGKYFDPVADMVFCVSLLVSHQMIWWGHPIGYVGNAFGLYFFWYGYSVARLRKAGILMSPDRPAKIGMFFLMTGLLLAFGSSLFHPFRNSGHVAAILCLLIAVVMTMHSLEKFEKTTEPRH
jgi:phosphatidylglycerophosphate synthase